MRNRFPGPRTLLVVTSLLGLAVTGSATAVTDASDGVRFTSAPRRVLQGHIARVAVAVQPSKARCSLAVRYRNGAMQGALQGAAARAGRATWTWRVPEDAATGPATATVTCRGAGRATRTITIVGETVPVTIKVLKQGFSIRPNRTRGNQVSYGVLLQNQSAALDAKDIAVVVNFVGPADVLIGSAASRITVIGASARYGLGGMVSFPAAAPVERLEVALQIGDSSPRDLRLPGVANTRVLPSLTEPSWVGSVEGEILNDTGLILSRVRLSVLVFDAQGNILGGGIGATIAPIQVGARQFFKVASGVNPILYGRAASAVVSMEPTYA